MFSAGFPTPDPLWGSWGREGSPQTGCRMLGDSLNFFGSVSPLVKEENSQERCRGWL